MDKSTPPGTRNAVASTASGYGTPGIIGVVTAGNGKTVPPRLITRGDAEEAWQRIKGNAVRTPLLRLPLEGWDGIHLKLENLQPIGSFKIRGAANAMLQLPENVLRRGVWTASAGNMAQGVAWCARRAGIPCTVVVPEAASESKVAAVKRLGARIVVVSRDEFFEIFATRQHAGLDGHFVHAFSDTDVMAGNGTIALEILEDMPDVDAIYVPYGGGGLACGIASVVRDCAPHVRVIACEPETAAPLTASFRSERGQHEFTPSFVDGAGGLRLYPEMVELAQQLFADAVSVSVADTASALRLMVERCHVVAEGAGALALAAALQHNDARHVACVVSGGNITNAWLSDILAGRVPAV